MMTLQSISYLIHQGEVFILNHNCDCFNDVSIIAAPCIQKKCIERV